MLAGERRQGLEDLGVLQRLANDLRSLAPRGEACVAVDRPGVDAGASLLDDELVLGHQGVDQRADRLGVADCGQGLAGPIDDLVVGVLQRSHEGEQRNLSAVAGEQVERQLAMFGTGVVQRRIDQRAERVGMIEAAERLDEQAPRPVVGLLVEQPHQGRHGGRVVERIEQGPRFGRLLRPTAVEPAAPQAQLLEPVGVEGAGRGVALPQGDVLGRTILPLVQDHAALGHDLRARHPASAALLIAEPDAGLFVVGGQLQQPVEVQLGLLGEASLLAPAGQLALSVGRVGDGARPTTILGQVVVDLHDPRDVAFGERHLGPVLGADDVDPLGGPFDQRAANFASGAQLEHVGRCETRAKRANRRRQRRSDANSIRRKRAEGHGEGGRQRRDEESVGGSGGDRSIIPAWRASRGQRTRNADSPGGLRW